MNTAELKAKRRALLCIPEEEEEDGENKSFGFLNLKSPLVPHPPAVRPSLQTTEATKDWENYTKHVLYLSAALDWTALSKDFIYLNTR